MRAATAAGVLVPVSTSSSGLAGQTTQRAKSIGVAGWRIGESLELRGRGPSGPSSALEPTSAAVRTRGHLEPWVGQLCRCRHDALHHAAGPRILEKHDRRTLEGSGAAAREGLQLG